MNTVSEGGAQIRRLVTDTTRLLADAGSAGDGDPAFTAAWDLLTDVVQLAAARLLERRFDELTAASGEVMLYLSHLERVTRVAKDAPFTVPSRVVQQLQAIGRFLESTKDLAEIGEFLNSIPGIVAALAAYLTREAGRRALPVVEVLDLAVRAGGLYQDCLERALPFL